MVGPDIRIAVAVVPGKGDRNTALANAEIAFSRIASRVQEAQRFAASQLLEYYNYHNAHLSAGEHLTAEAFARRLQLEGMWFGGKGRARLYFGHDLYRSDHLNEGGLILVQASTEGEFRRASWITEPDAQEPRLVLWLRRK
jgi:hypothetical protein